MKNMKKTKKFLLDEESTNEEILDEKFLEEEALDEEELEENEIKSKAQEYVLIFIVIVVLILGGCFINSFFTSKTHHKRECDWCGRFEECKMYTVSYVNGYNNNGTFKVDYDFMWFSDDCIYKAKNSGKWLKID